MVNNFYFKLNSSKLTLPILFFCIGIVLINIHNLFEESDGVFHYFSALDIIQITNYNNWASNFWPPLYPFISSFLLPYFDGFFVFKLVSLISGFVILLTIYDICFLLSLDHRRAFFAQLMTFVFSGFLISSIQAENHILDSCFTLLGIKYLVKFSCNKNILYVFLSGLFIGLAGLTRYTSYTFVPGILISLIYILNFRRFYFIIFFLAPFTLVSLPWWIINYINNSNPFHTWQYLNIGMAVSGFDFGEWWWKQSVNYKSINDLLMDFPLNYALNFGRNLLKVGYHLLLSLNILFFYLFVKFKSSKSSNIFLVLIFPSFIFFVLLVSQAFVFSEVLLSWYFVFIVCISLFIETKFELRFYRFYFFVFIIISIFKLYFYLVDYTDNGQLSDNSKIISIIKQQDSNLDKKFVMSIHPARSYYLNSKYLTLPLYFKGSVSDLVKYKGIHYDILKTIPTYPANILSNNPNIKADYLIFEQSSLKYLPQFKFLFDNNSLNIPSNFKLLYKSESCVVYKIK
jgi:hypothetical protein